MTSDKLLTLSGPSLLNHPMQYLVYVNGPQYKCQVYHPAWAEGTHSAPARILFLGRIRNKCKEKIPSPQVQRKGWFRIGFDQSDKAYWRRCPEPGLKFVCVCVCVCVACMGALSVHRLSWGDVQSQVLSRVCVCVCVCVCVYHAWVLSLSTDSPGVPEGAGWCGVELGSPGGA